MDLLHEVAARQVHSDACEFRPVYVRYATFRKDLVGWTFKVGEHYNADFCWVTANGVTSGDKLDRRADAAHNLIAYVKHVRATAGPLDTEGL